MNRKQVIRLTESDLNRIIKESVKNNLYEGKKKQKRRTGTIEMNGEHIRATEDGIDKYGNPMYKVKHPSIKGRKTKDGYTRVQHFNFKPDRVNESVYGELGMTPDERINRRIDNYLQDYPIENYEDSIYPEIGEDFREKADRERLHKHYRNNPKHKGLKYQQDEMLKENMAMGNYVENYENAYDELKDKILTDTDNNSYLIGMFNKIDNLMYDVLDGYRKYNSTEW